MVDYTDKVKSGKRVEGKAPMKDSDAHTAASTPAGMRSEPGAMCARVDIVTFIRQRVDVSK